MGLGSVGFARNRCQRVAGNPMKRQMGLSKPSHLSVCLSMNLWWHVTSEEVSGIRSAQVAFARGQEPCKVSLGLFSTFWMPTSKVPNF